MKLVAALLLAAGTAAAQVVAGSWSGTYTCAQGLTGLTLTMQEHGKGLRALFHFYAVPRNPPVPTGCFTMRGTRDPSGTITLTQDRWLHAPPSYLMVDMEGALSPDGTRFAGRITGAPSCTTFDLVRGKPPAPPPEACTGVPD